MFNPLVPNTVRSQITICVEGVPSRYIFHKILVQSYLENWCGGGRKKRHKVYSIIMHHVFPIILGCEMIPVQMTRRFVSLKLLEFPKSKVCSTETKRPFPSWVGDQ